MKQPVELEEEARPVAYFDATAHLWDASYEEESLRGHWQRCRLEAVVELIGAGSGALLDVGTGSGRLLAVLAERGWTVTGIDPAPRMIELARARLPAAAGRLTIAYAEALPFDDSSFDVVTAIGVLDYADVEPALGEVARVLRPAGRAVVGLRNGQALQVVWQRAVMHPIANVVKRWVPFGRDPPTRRRRPLSLRQARIALDTAGLSVEHVEHAGCLVLPDPLDWLAPRFAYRVARRAEHSRSLRRCFGTQRVFVATKS